MKAIQEGKDADKFTSGGGLFGGVNLITKSDETSKTPPPQRGGLFSSGNIPTAAAAAAAS